MAEVAMHDKVRLLENTPKRERERESWELSIWSELVESRIEKRTSGMGGLDTGDDLL